MKGLFASLSSKRGQSLVEMAIMLPILIIILVGIVELGFALANQMTVTTAAREGARYGARFGPTNEAEVNNAVLKVVTNTASSLFSMDQAHADVIVVRTKTDSSGNIGSSTDFKADSYWVQEVLQDSPNISGRVVTPDQIATDLNHEPNLAVIIVQSFYDHRSVLGIPLVAVLSDRIPIGTYTVMRIEPSQVKAPCCLFPFAVPAPDVAHVTPTNVFTVWVKADAAAGNWGWLKWNNNPGQGSEGSLEYRLNNPCEASADYENPADSSDTTIDRGDQVWGDSGISGSSDIRGIMDYLCGAGSDHICDTSKAPWIRVPVYDDFEGSGNNFTYRIYGFAIIQVFDYYLPAGNTEPGRLFARLIRLDNDACGAP